MTFLAAAAPAPGVCDDAAEDAEATQITAATRYRHTAFFILPPRSAAMGTAGCPSPRFDGLSARTFGLCLILPRSKSDSEGRHDGNGHGRAANGYVREVPGRARPDQPGAGDPCAARLLVSRLQNRLSLSISGSHYGAGSSARCSRPRSDRGSWSGSAGSPRTDRLRRPLQEELTHIEELFLGTHVSVSRQLGSPASSMSTGFSIATSFESSVTFAARARRS